MDVYIGVSLYIDEEYDSVITKQQVDIWNSRILETAHTIALTVNVGHQ